ncbi:MAG: dihydrofolate reductase [Actinomycetes bacterium]
MTVGLIWAQAANGVIGADGALPWHLPEDLARFRELTTGSTVLMGRQTWESLPDRARPLPGRRNVVLTRQRGWSAEGAVVAHSLAEALRDALADPAADVWVIGGGSVYRAALAHADRVEVTELRDSFEGDVHAPRLGSEWRVRRRDPESGWLLSRSGLHYRTVSYATE